MIGKIKRAIPHSIVNTGWHLPNAVLANIRYGFPSRKMKIIGVTGTDGKTTTVNMIYRILKESGKKVSMISTIYAEIGGKKLDTGFHVTSPSAKDVQKFIRQAKKAGSEYMVLEVTSHALDQHRFWGVHFDIGVITNITHEHLDYHKTFENYFKAKSKLIKKAKVAVLNRDDPNFARLSKLARDKVISFGLHKNANFNPQEFPVKVRLPGEYNVLNAMAASAVTSSLGVDRKTINEAISAMRTLPGRMEEVSNTKGVRVFIDFAHTPNGLTQALNALREKKQGKIIALIGAEGYRDVEKRSKLGEIATKLADDVIITSVDPRGLIEQINIQILQGVKKAKGVIGKHVFVENDRQKAIEMAINSLAKKGDTVAIFGKGHETSMNLDGKKEVPWSDKDAVEKALRRE